MTMDPVINTERSTNNHK